MSEIPYGLTDGVVLDPLPGRAFGYVPTVAGGTAFLYNLKIPVSGDLGRLLPSRRAKHHIVRVYSFYPVQAIIADLQRLLHSVFRGRHP